MKYTFSVLNLKQSTDDSVTIIADDCKLSDGFFYLSNAKMDFEESKRAKQFLINANKIDLVLVEEE